MSDDEQDQAEAFDEDVLGDDPVTSDELGGDDEWPPSRPHGVQFADADVTDESFAERSRQEEPEVWDTGRSTASRSTTADGDRPACRRVEICSLIRSLDFDRVMSHAD